METDQFIILSDFCEVHAITPEFVVQLQEYGLIEIIDLKDTPCLPVKELSKTEKMIRLYSELDINLEGIAVITQLLEEMQQMQKDIIFLRNKLRVYE
jgi:hypothetical protein